jgi:hypothetical protein
MDHQSRMNWQAWRCWGREHDYTVRVIQPTGDSEDEQRHMALILSYMGEALGGARPAVKQCRRCGTHEIVPVEPNPSDFTVICSGCPYRRHWTDREGAQDDAAKHHADAGPTHQTRVLDP